MVILLGVNGDDQLNNILNQITTNSEEHKTMHTKYSRTWVCGYTLILHLWHSCPMFAHELPDIHSRLQLGHLNSPKRRPIPWYGVLYRCGQCQWCKLQINVYRINKNVALLKFPLTSNGKLHIFFTSDIAQVRNDSINFPKLNFHSNQFNLLTTKGNHQLNIPSAPMQSYYIAAEDGRAFILTNITHTYKHVMVVGTIGSV